MESKNKTVTMIKGAIKRDVSPRRVRELQELGYVVAAPVVALPIVSTVKDTQPEAAKKTRKKQESEVSKP